MKLAILGATGSIGTQALDVADRKNYSVSAISCRQNIQKAEDAIRRFHIPYCAVEDEKSASLLKAAIKDMSCTVLAGKDSARQLTEMTDADTVLNAITGIAGLMPTVQALAGGKKLALANKESLVTAGAYVMDLAGKTGNEILPVDSEHCAIWQSLRAGNKKEVRKILLTASGGPFFGYTEERLATVRAEDALRHPTWNMGKKITVDSATLMNKGFEVIEACWLFGVDAEQIEVVVHRESIIHSMVEYIDGMVIAQMGVPDMRSCIQYALTAPERFPTNVKPLDFTSVGKLTFYRPDTKVFPLLALAGEVWKKGGCYGAAMNGANEVAVARFLENKITLPGLFRAVEEATYRAGTNDITPDAVMEADRNARIYANEMLG